MNFPLYAEVSLQEAWRPDDQGQFGLLYRL